MAFTDERIDRIRSMMDDIKTALHAFVIEKTGYTQNGTLFNAMTDEISLSLLLIADNILTETHCKHELLPEIRELGVHHFIKIFEVLDVQCDLKKET